MVAAAFGTIGRVVRDLLTPPPWSAGGKVTGGAHTRSLDAAGGGRRGAGLGTFGQLNSEIAAGQHMVGSRAAYLAANNAWMSNARGNLVAYLVGTGARPTARNVSRQERRQVQRRFETWAARTACR